MPSDREVTHTPGSDTLDGLRDRLAELCGWKHVPVNDLTALAAAWPEGWTFDVHVTTEGVWCYADSQVGRERSCGGTEYEARLRLTVAVLEADLQRPAR